MADAMEWSDRIDKAFEQVDVDGAKLQTLKLELLEVMRGAYMQGLREAANLHEKRKLVAILATSGPVTDKKTRIEDATKMVEQIMATVK